MKRLVTILSLLIITASLSAQNFQRKGFSLGADRDTLLYIIASPFDNWYITPSIGLQTFIGNAPDNEACWNKLDYNIRVEVGKWVIPDIAVALRVGFSTIHSQSLHGGNNPLTDLNSPITYPNAATAYYPISAYSFFAQGIVNMDWTNFLKGYERGKRSRFHINTPLGFGGIVLFGKVINQNYIDKVHRNDNENDMELGQMSRNLELAFTAGIMAEYYVSKKIAINASTELLWARGSLDDYNYNLDADNRRVDFMPSFNIGIRFNLLENVTKYNPYTKVSSREKVNHEFISFGSRNTLSTLKGRIDRLNSQIDSVQNLSDLRGQQDSLAIAAMTEERDSLQRQLDSADYRTYGRAPANMIEELISANEVLGLPATIVYFQLDRYDLDYNGRKRLQNFAKEISNVDDTVEFYIIGAADSLTGTKRHNMWLSERRSEAAYNMLVERFNVDPNQLIKIALGGITEYDPQENNRMAMVIMRTPEVEAIIERWTKDKK